MKKVLALLVSCTLALSLAGCSSQTDSGQTAEGSGKKVRIMIGYENNPGEPIDLACHESRTLAFSLPRICLRDGRTWKRWWTAIGLRARQRSWNRMWD